ncbi:hypothetical protein Scep_001963 [Stephania cephalantha]|uniref:Pectin acetylesterase n=1 Tax=Stephania cephalantha TaxID=152367 RepID=A0AAP0LAI2_9MAGN
MLENDPSLEHFASFTRDALLQESLAPRAVDPNNDWHDCKLNHAWCKVSQIKFLQGFRNQMLDTIKGVSKSNKNGLFINSCFAHCQSERQDTWFPDDSPMIQDKRGPISR